MGEDLIIIRPNGQRAPLVERRTATHIASGKQTWALNADDTVNITVQSPFPQSYEIGDKIEVFGRMYKLNRLPKVKKTGMHEYSYDLEFEGIQYDLLRVMYDVTVDTTNNTLQDIQGDSLTGDLRRFMTVLIANANRIFPGKWVLGACPDTVADKTLTFGESDNCLAVLQNLCSEQNFNVEFEIVTNNSGVNTINLSEKVGQTIPYVFEMGKGKGLYMLNRENVSSANIVTRLKVYGSTENITSKYRADRLCLPDKSKALSYIEKPEAVAAYGVFEGRKNFDIKPTFTGHITSINPDNVLMFTDTSFPFDLNEKESDGVTTKYLISGTTAKIHFNSGNLAGYEFDIHQYDHATHTFKLLKQSDGKGNEFPSALSAAFQFAVGDEYKIIDVTYPTSIIVDAEQRLYEAGNKWYDQNCQPKVQYGLQVTQSWLESLNANQAGIVNVFAPGDYVQIKDDDIGVNKAIRVKSFTRSILDPYDYSLTISDISTNAKITSRVLSELIEIDKVIDIHNLKDPAKARANWRSSREVLEMVFDPEGDYYTDKIKPMSIDTLMLSVGAKSMQFGLTNTVFQPNYNGNPNVMAWKGGVLTHYTINEDSATSWILQDGQISNLNPQLPYYIYAQCARANNRGVIVVTQQQIKVDSNPNFYFFWIGVLNSVDTALRARSIALTYGFTMINGRFIKTGRVESADGETYFDLDNGEIGGRIVFSRNGECKTLEQLGAESLAVQDYINSTLPGVLSNLNEQIDGKIDTWYQENDPSTEWTTNALKKEHIGDMWYKPSTNQLYRYSSTYAWELITDAKAIQAYAAASQAQDTADGKRTVFTSTPYPPYDIGDLWANATYGSYQNDLLVCVRAKSAGAAFDISDWSLATKYTDNSEFDDFVQNTFNQTVRDIQAQLDGQIEQFFYTYDPTMTNEPASLWTTTAEKENHLGDLFYNTANGKVFRFVKNGNVYSWLQLQDEELAQALVLAQNAYDLADGKRRIFASQPTTPYDIGDLWVQGINGDIMVCIRARESGAFVLADWSKASKYTDDTALNNFVSTTFVNVIGNLTTQIDGKVETWFQSENPANNWTTDAERRKHVDDIWYNTEAKTLWHYMVVYTNATTTYYDWVRITDQSAIDAYEAASHAQDTADGKRRVFTSTPEPPYDCGDLWVQGGNGDILVCVHDRDETERYFRSDWANASRYTDDSALTDFIQNTYTDTVDQLTEQIDGKIECWFQTTDPADNWATVEEKLMHVSDMWYHTTNHELKYYKHSTINAAGGGATLHIFTWVKVTDQTAIDAYEAASQAQDTADGKRRVFVDTPYAPYDIGDLWVDGEQLRRCIVDRDENSHYNPNDWVVAVYYDNTKTTIDGGLVTSGTLQVAGDNASILAGITGHGTQASSIRFWAGASFENRATAPFRVTQDGSVVMTKATVEGVIKALSGIIGGWSIRNNTLISNIGTVNGVVSTSPMTDGFVPYVTLDSEHGLIKLGSTLELSNNALKLLDNQGYSKLLVVNSSVGDYSDATVYQNGDFTERGDKEISGVYLPHSGATTPIATPSEYFIKKNLGYFDKNSIISIASFEVSFIVPKTTSGYDLTAVKNAPTMKLELLCDNVVVKTWTGAAVGTVSSGSTLLVKATPNESYNVGDKVGNYTIRISLMENGILLLASNYHGSVKTFTLNTSVSFSLFKMGSERTILGNDGILTTWKNSYMFQNGDCFCVKIGNQYFRVTSSGVQKKTGEGSVWTSV